MEDVCGPHGRVVAGDRPSLPAARPESAGVRSSLASVKREFLTYTVLGRNDQEETLAVRVRAREEEIRRVSREKQLLARCGFVAWWNVWPVPAG